MAAVATNPRTAARLRGAARAHSCAGGVSRRRKLCHKPLEEILELVTHKKWKGGRLMPWGKGTVVTGARGFVFLAGNTATADDYDPFKKGGGAVGDAMAQWRNILTNIKSDLEELGTSLDHLIRLTFFVDGPFPLGWVQSCRNLSNYVMAQFFLQYGRNLCRCRSSPPPE